MGIPRSEIFAIIFDEDIDDCVDDLYSSWWCDDLTTEDLERIIDNLNECAMECRVRQGKEISNND